MVKYGNPVRGSESCVACLVPLPRRRLFYAGVLDVPPLCLGPVPHPSQHHGQGTHLHRRQARWCPAWPHWRNYQEVRGQGLQVGGDEVHAGDYFQVWRLYCLYHGIM